MRKKGPLFSLSLLSANYGNMSDAVKTIESAKGDWIHFDIMDGNFVPNITFGPKMVKDLRPVSKLIFDVHLMINKPENYIEKFARAGADYINIQLESTLHVHRVLTAIKELGKKAGITIVPSTPVSLLEDVLHLADLVLIMTVNPGFGGQKLIKRCLKKIEQLAVIRRKLDYNYLIEADGGVNKDTYRSILKAGADVLVIGSAFFLASNPAGELREMRQLEVSTRRV